ncbi:hypothetical protein [Microcoleus sp. B9-D4]|uniref:hypothetical protein n=1 Tax=Microcoleus sp. B9-D4 TaxID=2818711 RepID=UPI002FD5C88B
MNLENISDKQLDLLKTEMNILATKISDAIDTLWKVRTAAITLWSAVLSIGLGSLSQTKEPSIILLVLTCLLPTLFIDIDARNNRWYRKLINRENAIQRFFNAPNDRNASSFPIYDIAGKYTFQGDKHLAWEFSQLRSLIDPIPLTFYGSQLIFSSVTCTIYTPVPWRYIFLPAAFLAIVGLLLVAKLQKRAYLAK